MSLEFLLERQLHLVPTIWQIDFLKKQEALVQLLIVPLSIQHKLRDAPAI